jgi:hypothetical protein
MARNCTGMHIMFFGIRPAGLLVLAGLGAVLAACNTTGSTTGSAPGPSVAATSNAPPAGPAACAQPIAAFETVIDSDVKVGQLNRSVYQRATADLASVRASCAAGQAGQAVSALAAVKSRYGYR